MHRSSNSDKKSNDFNNNNDTIELVRCPLKERLCDNQLKIINEKMGLAQTHWINKDFAKAIEELRVAFYATNELSTTSCVQCVALFRATIIKTLEALHEDLRQITTGFFKAKRHQNGYKLATSILDELRSVMSDSKTV
jgi:hypothetical protein